ncbi:MULTISPECIES: DUF502 domain-containing protein [Phyllobacteriaceae]|uniref:DUF502 domain-containing protein n=1 Tax=Phyllobacteriaceae TaxID=69277 RepID=UPI002ACAE463|nr:DUF502 domain-containing protein [Chelativorans sp. M5D2P16]MDZ5697676.1 DUF502 domain-containing protein [Chelativorans sp. M5D2P16]
MTRLRNYFLTGFIVTAPLAITLYLTWSLIRWVDSWVKPYIPARYNPDTYLPFDVPGFGLIVALVVITLAGFLTANIIGRTIVSYGEYLLGRMPLVRSIYRGLKQILETVLSERSDTFKKVGLIEYPRKGLWALVFIATEARGEVRHLTNGDDNPAVAVFLPTTPNPTSGYLLYVPRNEIIELDMSVEDGAKLVISAGLISPEYEAKTKALAEEALADQPARRRRTASSLPNR